MAWVGILARAQSLTNSGIWSKLLNFSVLQFHHVNGDNDVRIDDRIKLVKTLKTLFYKGFMFYFIFKLKFIGVTSVDGWRHEPWETSGGTLSKSTSRILFSRDGLLLFFFFKWKSWQVLRKLSAYTAKEVTEPDSAYTLNPLLQRTFLFLKVWESFPGKSNRNCVSGHTT